MARRTDRIEGYAQARLGTSMKRAGRRLLLRGIPRREPALFARRRTRPPTGASRQERTQASTFARRYAALRHAAMGRPEKVVRSISRRNPA